MRPRLLPPSGATARPPRMARPIVAAMAIMLAGASICAAFVLSSAVGALAAPSGTSTSVSLSGQSKEQVDSLTAQANTVQAEMDTLDDQLEGYSENFNELQIKLTDVNTQMSDLRRQLGQAQDDHNYRVKKFQSRIIALYKSGGSDGVLSVLLGSEGFNDLINRVRLIATLADQDQELVANLDASAQKLTALLAQIEDNKKQELALRGQIEGQQKQIQVALADRQNTLSGLDSRITAVIEQEQQRQEAQQAQLTKDYATLLSGGQTVDGLGLQTSNPVVNQLLQTALYYQGIPYVWAGDRPATGFDCSGFVQFVFRQHGVDLPHYSGFISEMGQEIMPENIQPGDVLCFGAPVHHVGIYVGNGLFIQAPRTGDVVRISVLNDRHDLAYIRRFNIQARVGPPAVW